MSFTKLMHIFTTSVCLLLASLSHHALAVRPHDPAEARNWCDNTMLDRVEGLWRVTDDESLLLVCRSLVSDLRYDIVVIDSPDTRLDPGDVVGFIAASPEANSFRMSLFRDRTARGIFGNEATCVARLTDDNSALLVSAPKLKVGLNVRWLLPSFWRAVRLNIDNPLSRAPHGLIRVYPNPSLFSIDYL